MADDSQTTTDVTEAENFCRLSVRSQRGTGTNDRDRVKATLQRDTREEVEAEREALVTLVEETLTEAREAQPVEEDDE